MTRRRVTTREAAEILGISVEAVRKRIEREQLDHEREDNRVYVYLDVDWSESGRDVEGEGTNALVEALREQVAYLRGVIAQRDRELEQRAEEIRRRDSALEREQQLAAMFADRLRELEAPRESPVSSEPARTPPDAGEEAHAATERPHAQEEQLPRRERSWWREFFGIGG